MNATQTNAQLKFLDRTSFVDFALILAILNVAVSLVEMVFGMVGTLSFPLRIALTIAAAGAIQRMGKQRGQREGKVTHGFPDPVVHDLRTGFLNRNAFFKRFDANLKHGGHGFLMLVHANDIEAIDKRFGANVGDHFLATLLARFDPTIQKSDLIGILDRETYVAFLMDRTRDEVDLIGRRMCGATLLPLNDSMDRARLSACVGFTEVAPNEPILDALERANEALTKAQGPESSRLEMWSSARAKGKIYDSF